MIVSVSYIQYFVTHINFILCQSTTVNQSLDHLLKCYDKFANGSSTSSTTALNKNEKSAQHEHPQHGTLGGMPSPNVHNLLCGNPLCIESFICQHNRLSDILK
jgi:hypothetical protein